MIRGRAKDVSHEKLKTWIDLHDAWCSGDCQVESTRQGLSRFYQGILQLDKKGHRTLMGGPSGSNLVEEVLSVNKLFAFFTDPCF